MLVTDSCSNRKKRAGKYCCAIRGPVGFVSLVCILPSLFCYSGCATTHDRADGYAQRNWMFVVDDDEFLAYRFELDSLPNESSPQFQLPKIPQDTRWRNIDRIDEIGNECWGGRGAFLHVLPMRSEEQGVNLLRQLLRTRKQRIGAAYYPSILESKNRDSILRTLNNRRPDRDIKN